MIIKFLIGKKVYLRPLLEEDYLFLLRWTNDPEVRPFLNRSLPTMEAEEKEWIERLHKNKGDNVVLMICLTEGDRPIGTMGLHGINQKDGVATTGAMIGEKDYWGKGYGTEAKMILLDHAFNTLNLRKICSSVFAFNGRSLRYLEKSGYVIEGTLKKQLFINGKYVDEVLLAVFKKDFMLLWKKFKKEHLS
jgi:RimJ/RimL family protein N-acetyltransferase